jgi:hypothetical protein
MRQGGGAMTAAQPLVAPLVGIDRLSDDDRPVWVSPAASHVDEAPRGEVDVVAIPGEWGQWSTFDWKPLRGREVHLVYVPADDPVMRGTSGDTPALTGIREALGHGAVSGSVVSLHKAAGGGVDDLGNRLFAPRATPEDRHQRKVAEKVADLRALADARAVLAATDAVEAGERVRGAWLTRDELDALEPAEPLIGGKIFRQSIAAIAGDPGSYKTFLAVDWACSVATGVMWQHHATTQGRVVYLVGEGRGGIRKRIRAWEMVHDRRAEIEVYPMPAPLHTPDAGETEALVATILERKPDLIVVDTLHRYTPGMDENSAQDMGRFITVLSRLKDETGACVLVIHHTGYSGHERGSTSFRAAVDELFLLRDLNRAKLTVTLVDDRHKELPSGTSVQLSMQHVLTDVPVEDPSSLVVAAAVDPLLADVEPEPPANMPTLADRKVTNLVRLAWNMYVFMADHGGDGWTVTDIRRVIETSPMPLTSANRQQWSKVWGTATKTGVVVQTNGQRWELDVDKAEAAYGFDDKARDYYLTHVVDMAEGADDGGDQ